MSLATNRDKIVRQSVMGRVHHPVLTPQKVYRVGSDGGARFTPAHGAITYDIEIGDSCMGLVGDHIEPGVSSKNADDIENRAYTHLSCIGNVAEVVTGKAAGDKGFVTGTHGGIDHVMIWFSQETLNKMVCDDKILVKAYGQGLALVDYPQVKLMSVDPDLFDKLNIQEEDGHLVVPVSAVIPAYLMGSGLGAMEVLRQRLRHHDPRPRLPGRVPPGRPPLRRPGVHPGPPVLPRPGLPAGLRHGGRDHPR